MGEGHATNYSFLYIQISWTEMSKKIASPEIAALIFGSFPNNRRFMAQWGKFGILYKAQDEYEARGEGNKKNKVPVTSPLFLLFSHSLHECCAPTG